MQCLALSFQIDISLDDYFVAAAPVASSGPPAPVAALAVPAPASAAASVASVSPDGCCYPLHSAVEPHHRRR